ncbi:MAG: hypothetical protein LBQ15_01935 [Clostridium sp.]|jgi:hypothetical protein|nr:hypothetical protein [Clostridium sp.]
MGLIESLLPDTIPLTEEQFRTFLDKTLTTEHSRRILAGLTAQNAATATPEGAETARRDNPTPAAEPAGTTQEDGSGGSGNEGGGTRVTG